MIATCDPEVLANLQHCDVVFKLLIIDHYFMEGVPWQVLNKKFRGSSAFI